MSTTVSYKGQTLTTVSNATKTLLTEGKYLEDDLTLVDVSGGGAVLTTKNISANGTYNASSDSADGYSQVTVAVPASAVDSGTKSIGTNGTHDVVGYASANVNVPNSYSASDEGKVVSNGALVAQSSQNIDTNGTYDTTLKNEVVVNVSGGGGSGCVSLLDTITVPENTRALRVDLADYQNYNFLFVYLEDFVLTASDWLYAVKNDTSGGLYGGQQIDHSGVIATQFNAASGQANPVTVIRQIANGISVNIGVFSYLYLYCYYESSSIKAGSKVKIYGGNYADM